MEGICPWFGVRKSARTHTLNFSTGCLSFSNGLNFGFPVLKNVGLVFPSFIWYCSFLNFNIYIYVYISLYTYIYMKYILSQVKIEVGNEHAIRGLIAF